MFFFYLIFFFFFFFVWGAGWWGVGVAKFSIYLNRCVFVMFLTRFYELLGHAHGKLLLSTNAIRALRVVKN